MKAFLIIAVAALCACGEKDLVAVESPPLAADGGMLDSGPQPDLGDVTPPPAPYPGGCTADSDCNDTCSQGICVPTPPQSSFISCANEPQPQSRPALSCWSHPVLADGPDTVPAQGRVEYFGDGDPTVGLRIRVYPFTEFDPRVCVNAADGIPGIFDARQAVEDCIDAQLTPIADTVTEACDPPDPINGCYTLPALPTGKRLVVRITGALDRWVPTYQFGTFINPCSVPVLRDSPGICPEEFPEVDSTVDWTCSLTADPAGDYFAQNFSVISQATWISFPPTTGVLPRINPGNGAVAGRLFDCSGRSVLNATFALANPGTVNTYFNGDPNDTLPQPGLTYTNSRGTFANLNTPAGPNGVIAVVQKADGVTPLGYERFFVLPNTVTIINPGARPPIDEEPPY